jgi:hypothetical protein
LAEELLQINKRESAKVVLDKCIELMPNERIPYGYFMLTVANAYYTLNEFEKANDVLSKIEQNAFETARYYSLQKPEIYQILQKELELPYFVLRQSANLAKQYNQLELLEKFEKDEENIILMTNNSRYN